MNNQRQYAQPTARPQNQAGPTIRAGLSVQELKAMTAMRVAHDDAPATGVTSRDVTNSGLYRNPASSYQTATPQQLQAAGIQPLVINERPALRQPKSVPPSAFSPYGDQEQSRAYSYESSSAANTPTSYAKANSTAGTAPALSAYHQQILPNRAGAPQVNSVEDVKEMTRLRMLMAERDAFFESSAISGRSMNNNNSNSHDSNNGSEAGGSNNLADFDIPFEDTANNRYGSRFLASNGPSVNNSTDSYDSYEYRSVVPQEARARVLPPAHAPSPLLGGLSAPPQSSLYAPPSQQLGLYGGNEYAGGSGSANHGNSGMVQSASLRGLGLRGPVDGSTYGRGLSNNQSLSELSLHSNTSLSGSGGYGQSALSRPNVGGTLRPSANLGLGLAGSSAVGRRPLPMGAPLAPVERNAPLLSGQGQGQYGGYSVERGIERNLMLNAQLTGHNHHHGLLNGIDRVEQGLNHHTNGHNQGQGLYSDDLLAPVYQNHLNLGRNTSGSSTTTHSTRSSYTSASNNNNQINSNQQSNNNQHSNNSSFLYGNGSESRGELSLAALLGDNSPYFGSDATTPVYRADTIYDLLSAEPMAMPRKDNNNNNNNNDISNKHHDHALLSSLEIQTSSPQKILLDPLSATSSPTTPSLAVTTAASIINTLSVDTRTSPRPLLAPLTDSPSTSITTSSKEHHTPGVRKLSLVGKAATYNEAVSSSFSAKHAKVLGPERGAPATELEPIHTDVSPSRTLVAFGEGGHSDSPGILGIASPDKEMKSASTAAHTNKKFPLVKASTTSRIPSDSLSPGHASSTGNGTGTRSPKMMGSKCILSKNHNNSNNSYDYTPPGSASLDRSASDSNFLASEMAEMVLDTPTPSTHQYRHSRQNSSDLSRLLAGMNNSGSDADNSLPSVTNKTFKRNTLSSMFGFD